MKIFSSPPFNLFDNDDFKMPLIITKSTEKIIVIIARAIECTAEPSNQPSITKIVYIKYFFFFVPHHKKVKIVAKKNSLSASKWELWRNPVKKSPAAVVIEKGFTMEKPKALYNWNNPIGIWTRLKNMSKDIAIPRLFLLWGKANANRNAKMEEKYVKIANPKFIKLAWFNIVDITLTKKKHRNKIKYKLKILFFGHEKIKFLYNRKKAKKIKGKV